MCERLEAVSTITHAKIKDVASKFAYLFCSFYFDEVDLRVFFLVEMSVNLPPSESRSSFISLENIFVNPPVCHFKSEEKCGGTGQLICLFLFLHHKTLIGITTSKHRL